MLPEEETLLLKAAKAARKAYLPEMDNWDDLKPSAVRGWVDVARAVRDSVDDSRCDQLFTVFEAADIHIDSEVSDD